MMTAGLGLLGVASYVLLVAVGRTSSAIGYSAFSVFWAGCFGLVIGVFFPLEQLISRAVAAAGGTMPFLVRRLILVYGAIAAVMALLLVVAGKPIADNFAGGRRGLPIALAGFLVVYFLQSVQRGWFAGSANFGRYALQLGVEGALRLFVAVGLLIAVDNGGERFAAVAVVFAALMSVIVLGRVPLPAGRGGAPPDRWRVVLAEAGALSASASLALVVMNAGPAIVVRLDGTNVSSAAFAAVFIVARVPLFFIGALQALAMPSFARFWAARDRRGFNRHFAAIALPAAIAVVLIAPALGWSADLLARTLFRPEYQIGSVRGIALAVSTGLFLMGAILQSALVAAERVSWVGITWVCAVLVFAVIIVVVPGAAAGRVSAAYVGCSLCVVLLQAFLLRRLVTESARWERADLLGATVPRPAVE